MPLDSILRNAVLGYLDPPTMAASAIVIMTAGGMQKGSMLWRHQCAPPDVLVYTLVRGTTMDRVVAAFFLVCLSPSVAAAWEGSVTKSFAPSDVNRLSLDKERIAGVGVPLAQLLKALKPKTVFRIPAEFENERYDVTITADGSTSLTEALLRALRRVDIAVDVRQETVSVWVLRPTGGGRQQVKSYAPEVQRSHFSCRQCSVAELTSSLERELKRPVIVEPEGLTFSNVMIEWVDRTSLIASLREVLAMDLSLEARQQFVWVVHTIGNSR